MSSSSTATLQDGRVIAQVLETDNYDLFQDIEGNRIVNDSHVDKLVQSITDNGSLILPVIVNEEGKKIDGQHRIEAYKRLEMPVPYIIAEGYGIEQVKVLNINQKNWGIMDYIRSWALRGNDNYQVMLDFMINHRFPVNPSWAMLTGNTGAIGQTTRANITSGGFVVSDLDRASAIAGQINEIIENQPWLRTKEKFLFSILGILRVEGYSQERMVAIIRDRGEQLENFTDNMRNCQTKLQRLYNHRLTAENKLRFFHEPL